MKKIVYTICFFSSFFFSLVFCYFFATSGAGGGVAYPTYKSVIMAIGMIVWGRLILVFLIRMPGMDAFLARLGRKIDNYINSTTNK